MKKHLINVGILIIFSYFIISIWQKTLNLTLYSDLASSVLALMIFALTSSYYIIKYLEGEFSEKKY